MSKGQRISAVLGVMVALGWPFRSLILRKPPAHLTTVRGDLHTILIEWIVVLILAAIAFGWQRLRPEFFRFHKFGWRDVLYMLGAIVGAFVLTGIVSTFAAAPKLDFRQIAATPLPLRCGLVLTAAICEEFMYRGFAIEELGQLVGNRWLGALVSLLFFGLGHFGIYGFSTALLIPTSVGLMITLLYMFRDNLPICMLMHGTMDGLFLIVVPALSGK